MLQGGRISVSLQRLRFSIIRDIEDVWFEIGAAPLLQTHNVMSGEEKKRGQHREILQRFVFEVNKQLLKASRESFIVESRIVFPHINMNACDHKQERALNCLKSAGSLFDCTPCLMPLYVSRKKTSDKAL